MDYIDRVARQNAEAYARSGKPNRFCIETFGCQMNEHDSEKIAGMLEEMGFIRSDSPAESEFVIFNTCCVRENAEEKLFGRLGAVKNYKKLNPAMIIAVCGCMMQEPDMVKAVNRKYRHVDIIFGTFNLHALPELVYRKLEGADRIIEVPESGTEIVEGVPVRREDGIKAWVTIMYGCNNFCSYCIVPYVRGRERSRAQASILEEIRGLAADGYKEVTLLGQNVNSYGKDLENGGNFAGLLREAVQIGGIERIRFMTSHPKDLSDELIAVMAEYPRICKQLHLPIQSGSTRLLEKMNRRYTKERYIELAGKVRAAMPGIGLTTDIIVGFPGETEEDFEQTLDVIERVRFDSAFTFLYSARAGTPAAESPDQIPDEVKKARFERLLAAQNRISREINDALAGRTVEVLAEGPSKRNAGIYTGRTETGKIVNFEADEDVTGKLVKVTVTKSLTWNLEGSIIK